MMRSIQVLIFIFLVQIAGFGQIKNEELKTAEEMFSANRFFEALPYCLDLLKRDTSDINLNYRIGMCYLNSRSQKSKAVHYLSKAVFFNGLVDPETNPRIPVTAHKSLGDAYLMCYDFDRASEAYETFRKIVLSGGEDIQVTEELNWKLAMCRFGRELRENMLADGRYSIIPDKAFFEETPIHADTSGIRLYPDTDTIADTDSEATVGISADGQGMLIYRNEKGESNLYVSCLNDNQWTIPEKVSKTNNTKGWETDECISADGSTIYFTSPRPGGYGGKDIYKAEKMQNGEWGKAINLGAVINSSKDEEAPFIHPDRSALYFSSNKLKSGKGFDVFMSALSGEGKYSEPVNVGYPVAADTNSFHSSYAGNGYDQKKNYLMAFGDQRESVIAVLKGRVVDYYGNGFRDVRITVTDNTTGEVTGIYDIKNEKGQYLIVIPSGKNINVTYEAEGYLFCSENLSIPLKSDCYEIRQAVQIPPIVPGSKVWLNNILFDSGKAVPRAESGVELNRLCNWLTLHPGLTVEISDYPEQGCNTRACKKLSRDRAEYIANYLAGKGISPNRVVARYKKHAKEGIRHMELKVLKVN